MRLTFNQIMGFYIIQPLIITMGFKTFYMADPKPVTGFYKVYPKPSPYG